MTIPTNTTPRVSLRAISKRFPGVLANDQVNLDIYPGEIHALLGENGAGKSTLMKMIYGVMQPDEGRIFWDGLPVEISAPSEARQLGIGMVFQHFSLFETLTVAENIALCLEPAQAKDMTALGERIREVSRRYGMALEPDRLVHTLSIGERQRVEIVRCLIQKIRLLILDEPTSVLTPQEVEGLFTTLRQLAEEGCSILFISHKLNEVQALCHNATILRGGQVTGECVPAEETAESIARLMVGDDTPVSAIHDRATGGEEYLSIRSLDLVSKDPFGVSLKGINLSVRAGEIVGIAGVAGNGQEELLAALSGESLETHRESIRLPQGYIAHMYPGQRREEGLAFVPEERLGRGAVPDMSLVENGLLTAARSGLVKHGLINWRKTRAFAQQIVSQFNVKSSGIDAPAKSLSGGNLQKFIMGREILQHPTLLIASHPTWGVDIGAAVAIHKELISLRNKGAAILIVSEDLDELFEISDRICAICHGRLSPMADTARASIAQVGSWMAGHFELASEGGEVTDVA
ncbi:ABC transporter ATP-binding protein [Aestuariirhabdus litorea]|uniref:ABC transporter ATP-binding protein n=1 Tax=Aestuariirhabdus litorea TaxID=2528527 RepID=A0A3P3VL28_9GAMM|nr:ABC transporter ATP-binding protein [Aestuariirhabdus litorea]RRJ83094.1 ABC transporter ATP-binding protein [Aestuariirhabdus litorea]RWW93251.1 ATP-binding cassette domain-containing protein [Endozoicomonadaceae bacterium GTF-13]